jgi:hypothetical protein
MKPEENKKKVAIAERNVVGSDSWVKLDQEYKNSKDDSEGWLSMFARSYVVWALVALLAVDIFCKLNWNNLRLDHYASPNRSMVWWTVDDFRKQKENPDLVVIGSSLMMHALHGGDAEYLKLPQNEVMHHRCAMLEDLIQKKTGVKVKSFAFALAGQMASDAYALTTTLLSERKPKMIVYGIAPRDLMDNTLDSPASTEIFKFMGKLGGTKDCAWQARHGLWEKIEYMLEQASALYDHRNYFVYLQQHYVHNLLRLFGHKYTDEVHTPFALRRLTLLDLPEDIGSNERIALPNLEVKFVDNSDEYRRRYQPFKQNKFQEQVDYLAKLMAYCQNEGIKLVLVNMPLTDDNIALMPAGTYDLYKRTVSTLASRYNDRFIDLQDSKLFPKKLYCDTAHMSGYGGVVFFNSLADKLTDGSQIAAGTNGSWQ